MNTRTDTRRKKNGFKERMIIRFIPLFIALIQRLYGFTLKRINIGQESFDRLRAENKNWIYAIWHTNVFFSPYLNRGQNIHVMISSSRDGELIHKIVRHYGNHSIRGSSSRGGAKALITLINILKKGGSAAITPDGPRGPAFVIQQGLVTAAIRSGTPIIPFHYEATRQWIAEKSWDKHRLPKPFSTLVVSYGEPIYLEKFANRENIEEAVKLVQSSLDENMQRCRQKVSELRIKK